MSDYLGLVMEMVGPPQPNRPESTGWQEVETGQGVELPGDFKVIVEAYAPVQLNGHLYLCHPGTSFFNLGENMSQDIAAFEAIDWEGVDARFRGRAPRFGGPDGLIPVVRTDRGEVIFLVRPAVGDGWHVVGCTDDGEQFVEYEMGFAEWLYRYLVGEEMVGPGSAALYPGPLLIEDLPRSPGDRTTERLGPERGM